MQRRKKACLRIIYVREGDNTPPALRRISFSYFSYFIRLLLINSRDTSRRVHFNFLRARRSSSSWRSQLYHGECRAEKRSEKSCWTLVLLSREKNWRRQNGGVWRRMEEWSEITWADECRGLNWKAKHILAWYRAIRTHESRERGRAPASLLRHATTAPLSSTMMIQRGESCINEITIHQWSFEQQHSMSARGFSLSKYLSSLLFYENFPELAGNDRYFSSSKNWV